MWLWQRNKNLSLKAILKTVFIGHLVVLVLLLLIGSYRPVLMLSLRKQAAGRMPIFFQSLPVRQKTQTHLAQTSLVQSRLVQTSLVQTSLVEPIKKVAQNSKPVQAVRFLSKAKKKKEKKQEKPIFVQPKEKKPQKKQEISKVLPEKKEVPKIVTVPPPAPEPIAVPEAPPVHDARVQELDLGILGQTTTEQVDTFSDGALLADCIAQQWQVVAGMPQDFFVDLSFMISAEGKAAEIILLDAHPQRVYQAYAKQCLLATEFPARYHKRKCRIILRA